MRLLDQMKEHASSMIAGKDEAIEPVRAGDEVAYSAASKSNQSKTILLTVIAGAFASWHVYKRHRHSCSLCSIGSDNTKCCTVCCGRRTASYTSITEASLPDKVRESIMTAAPPPSRQSGFRPSRPSSQTQKYNTCNIIPARSELPPYQPPYRPLTCCDFNCLPKLSISRSKSTCTRAFV